MKEISSAHNPKFKLWKSLLESKGIKKENRAIVSGDKLVRELLEQNAEMIEEILLPPKIDFSSQMTATRLSSPLFQSLDILGTHSPLAVVRVQTLSPVKLDKPQGLELIVSLGDPSNLGALLRSAEAFGVRRVILTKECASPFLPKALKAASLSTFRLNLVSTGSLRDLEISAAVALDMKGTDLATFTWPKNVYLILGEEGPGLPPHLKTQRLKIPMMGKTESLNATVAASLALYSYRLSTAKLSKHEN